MRIFPELLVLVSLHADICCSDRGSWLVIPLKISRPLQSRESNQAPQKDSKAHLYIAGLPKTFQFSFSEERAVFKNHLPLCRASAGAANTANGSHTNGTGGSYFIWPKSESSAAGACTTSTLGWKNRQAGVPAGAAYCHSW